MIDADSWDKEWLRVQREGQTVPWTNAAATAEKLAHVLGLGPGSSVLELGCGRGLVAIELALRGIEVSAVDFSASALALAGEYAQSRGARVHWQRADLRELPERRFTAVIVRGGILAQLAEPGEFQRWVGQAAERLEPGGALLLQLYTKEFALVHGIESRLYHDAASDCFCPVEGPSSGVSARLFTREELAATVAQGGLRLVREQFWSGRRDPPGPPHRGVTLIARAVASASRV